MQVQPLTKSPTPDSVATDTKLKNACRQLTAVFWNQVVAAMKQTIPDGGILDGSREQGIYQDMLFEQYAQLLAQQESSNGLGAIIYHQLGGKA